MPGPGMAMAMAMARRRVADGIALAVWRAGRVWRA